MVLIHQSGAVEASADTPQGTTTRETHKQASLHVGTNVNQSSRRGGRKTSVAPRAMEEQQSPVPPAHWFPPTWGALLASILPCLGALTSRPLSLWMVI